jgi:hypothetical protein
MASGTNAIRPIRDSLQSESNVMNVTFRLFTQGTQDLIVLVDDRVLFPIRTARITQPSLNPLSAILKVV